MPVFVDAIYAEAETESLSLVHKPDRSVFLLVLLTETHR